MESLSELENPLLPQSPYPYPEASPSWSCQDKLYSYLLGGTGPARAHQFLDPGSLQLAVEAWYRPSCLLGRDTVKEPRAGSCETSFTESPQPQAGPMERDTGADQEEEEDVAIQTVSYGVHEELQGQEDEQEEEEVSVDSGFNPQNCMILATLGNARALSTEYCSKTKNKKPEWGLVR